MAQLPLGNIRVKIVKANSPNVISVGDEVIIDYGGGTGRYTEDARINRVHPNITAERYDKDDLMIAQHQIERA
jgi:hypothetical protein